MGGRKTGLCLVWETEGTTAVRGRESDSLSPGSKIDCLKSFID